MVEVLLFLFAFCNVIEKWTTTIAQKDHAIKNLYKQILKINHVELTVQQKSIENLKDS